MKYAIVESGGKQYKAVEGVLIEVDRLQIEVGEKVTLDSVLLLVNDDEISIGSPNVSGSKVETTVEDQIKGKKITVFKYKPSKRYRVKTGHRQKYTLLRVDSIVTE